jgi:hypothetical protein
MSEEFGAGLNMQQVIERAAAQEAEAEKERERRSAERRAAAMKQRYMAWAGRFIANSRTADKQPPEPTDANFEAAFRDCVLPAKPEMYDGIREALAEQLRELGAER